MKISDRAIEIRPFQPSHAERISQLIVENFRQVLVRDYSPGAIAAMVAANQPGHVIQHAAIWDTRVAWLDTEIGGTASLSGDRVRHVFVAVHQHGRGIGRELIAALEVEARSQGLERLQLQSGLSAVGFYEKLGYQSLQRHEREINGHPLPVVLMEKIIIEL